MRRWWCSAGAQMTRFAWYLSLQGTDWARARMDGSVVRKWWVAAARAGRVEVALEVKRVKD